MSLVNILQRSMDYFGSKLDPIPNYIFLGIFAILTTYIIIFCFRSKYWWFNISFLICFLLELIGFIGRVMSLHDQTRMGPYVMQSTCLTIAPVFIMAGIYVVIGQFNVFHGDQYSIIKPITYSYFFITTDVISFLIQGAGGGLSAMGSSSNLGSTLLIIGVAFQLGAMTLLLALWFHFLYNIFFEYSGFVKFKYYPSFGNYIKMLLNVRSARAYKLNHLDEFYNPKFMEVRAMKLFTYMPLAMTIAVIAVYIRCIYRVVELAQGWNGYLMRHEIYLLVLDSAMIAFAGLIFIPFHPYYVFGKENKVKVRDIKIESIYTNA